MKVNIKKINQYAVVPVYSKVGDAGLDLTATDKYYDDAGNIVYNTGLAIEIPEGYVGLIFPRSSIANLNIALTNCVGVIDSGYRGEIICKFKYTAESDCRVKGVFKDVYDVGDRVAQLIIIPYPNIELIEVEDLSTTLRGTGGFGSSGQ